jgi:hypothetical protein
MSGMKKRIDQENLHNGDNVAPIKSDSTNVENAGNRSIRAETNEVDADAAYNGNPDSVQRRSS